MERLGKHHQDKVNWGSLITSYSADELRAIKFSTEKRIGRATLVLFTDKELQRMPVDIADVRTLIVPRESITLLQERGLVFEVSPLASPSPQERIRLKRKQQASFRL